MPRSSIEMKALIKTERQEKFREEKFREEILLINEKINRKQKNKNLNIAKLSVNPLIRFFVLPKIS